MPETQMSTDQQQALEAFVLQIQTDDKAVDASAASYVNSMVSGSSTVGPSGGTCHGWITYTGSDEKIHYEAIKITDYWGLAALATALPLVGVLDAGFLAGKTGRFEIHGFGGAATLQAWVDGRPVFKSPIPFAGTGFPGHGVKGEMRFTRG